MSYKATPEIKLKRFLYLSSESPTFISGNPEIHNYYKPDNLTCVGDLLKDDATESKGFLTNLFVSVENEPLVPRKDALFFALACLITDPNTNNEQRHSFYTMVLTLCRSNDDLFTFVKFVSKIKKPISSGLQKIINVYYFRQEPMELVKCISESNSYHGWTHKDLLKLIHCKTDNQAVEVIVKYVLYGEQKAVEVAGENEEALKVIEYIQKVKEYRTCNDENKVAQFISELNIKYISQIPPALMKSQMVWGALIPHLSFSDLINCLPKLYKMGFLKSGPIQTKIIEILSCTETIQSSNIHPVEVYIALKNLEKGGKPKDPHLIKYLESKEDVEAKLLADPQYKKPNFAHQEPAKCALVISAMYKALTSSYANLRTVPKRILVTIDTNERMDGPCLTTKNVTCLEAAVLIAYCLHRSNKVVAIAVFNGNTITPVPVDKHTTLTQLHRKVKEAKSGSPFWSAPFDWAMKGNKMFDVFVHLCVRLNFLDLTKEEREKDKPKEAFSNYMKKMNLPHTRLIACSLNLHNARFADGSTNIMDVCGFDKNTPKVIDAFCKNLF